MSDYAMEKAFENEMEILDAEFESGELSNAEYNKAVRDLQQEYDEEETRYHDERDRW